MENNVPNIPDYPYGNYSGSYNTTSPYDTTASRSSYYDECAYPQSQHYSNRHSEYANSKPLARGQRARQQSGNSGIGKKVLIGCCIALVVVILLYLIYVFLMRLAFAGAVFSAVGGA